MRKKSISISCMLKYRHLFIPNPILSSPVTALFPIYRQLTNNENLTLKEKRT